MTHATEQDDFNFARLNSTEETRTAEADMMDWADDIAYSVHDLEDFQRCHLIPWPEVLAAEGRERLIEAVAATRTASVDESERKKFKAAHRRLRKLIDGTVGDLLDQPYEATRDQRRAIRLITSTFIGRYVKAVHVRVPKNQTERCVYVDDYVGTEVTLLKQITREYILKRPALLAQQRGQCRILTELFQDLWEPNSERYLPTKFAELFNSGACRARCVADCISSLTERETIALHGRLRGRDSGSLLDPIVR